jgi:F-type H+-transporting ATPase subunit b
LVATIALVAAEDTGTKLILPATNELIWGTVSFLLLLLVLWRVGVFKRIREALAERAARIQGNIEQAELEREESERLLAEYRKKLDSARDEANRIIQEARDAGEQVRRVILERAQEESARIIEGARQEIVAERERAAQELRREVGALAVSVAERVVGSSLDGQRQQRLIDDYIEELSRSGGPAGPGGGANGGP